MVRSWSSCMDVETAGAIESLRDELRELIADTRRHSDDQFDSVRTDVRALAERVEDNRRHADVLHESVRDDIRMVADGVATLLADRDRR